jgi:hypothetical protein
MATTAPTDARQKHIASLALAREARREKRQKELEEKLASGNPFVVAPLTLPSLPMLETKSEISSTPQPMYAKQMDIRDEGKGVFPPAEPPLMPFKEWSIQDDYDEMNDMMEVEEKKKEKELKKKRKRVEWKDPVEEEGEIGVGKLAIGKRIKQLTPDILDHISLPDVVPKDLADYMYGIGDFLSKAGPILGGLLIARILLSIRGWLRDSPGPSGYSGIGPGVKTHLVPVPSQTVFASPVAQPSTGQLWDL